MPDATHAADLILKIYDLRREPEMRKARRFVTEEFWPQSFEDMVKVAMSFGTPENAWIRQVVSYWDMAAALVVHGAIDPDLFFDTNGEMWALYVKFKPFLEEGRRYWNAPEFMANVEKVATGTQKARDRVSRMEDNFRKWADMRRQAAQSKASGS